MLIAARSRPAPGPRTEDDVTQELPAALEGGGESDDARPAQPVLAVVGRPNVGKSTLVNRIIGRREAVVQDVPGVTRDRVAYDALWNGRRFTLVDTGGWDPDAKGMQAAISAQAEVAMRTADAILLVVDGQVGATTVDEAVARRAAPLGPPGAAVRDEGRRRARARRDRGAVAPRARGAAPGVGPARPRLRRPARRRARRAARVPPRRRRPRGRPAARRAGGQAERREVVAAQPADRREPGGRRLDRRHHHRPGRLPRRDRRRGLAARRHRRPAPQGRARPRAWSTTRRCAPRAPSRRPR